MKRLLLVIAAVAMILSGCHKFEEQINQVNNRVDNLEERVLTLEELCKQMNTNISSLQSLVKAVQQNDYVTGVTPITKNGEIIGYTISFTKSDPITIYHGKDGKDGTNGTDGKDGQNGQDGNDGVNGADGKDGHTPIIGVKQDSDGVYYWTVDGEWLLDANGNKIKAVGTDGKDGENGKDGQDGTNGTDGKDGADGSDGNDGATGPQGPQGEQGVTPQLKIENDYWYISYDNGKSWTQLGKATGEQGPQGDKGDKGDVGLIGDSMFTDIDYTNDDYIVFTLSNGTEIKLPTWYAFEQLQKLCNQMNTNISSLQVIVAALQNNDYVQSIVPLMDNGKEVGYTITFTKSGAVNIYHGKDGANGNDGQNGTNGVDGKDGHTPQIGVKQDTDGIYYWTVDGEWLLDDNGNKIKSVGTDGKDGQDGANGNDGQNGTNGTDGITPELKIENGYWYVSYDNGSSWKQLGKATGEDGKDGQDGTNGTDGKDGADGKDGVDGKDGDSFFQSIDASNSDYVILTLADGTEIKLPTWYAFEQLQKLCNQMNTNISSLQVIVAALQNNDYVQSIVPLMDNGKEVGYTITFTKSGAVNIYHGKDGKDGANGTDGKDGQDGTNGADGVNGTDGKDGHTPIIGVKQHTDGIYYWTIDGEWLLDNDGNKVKAVGTDGKDGANGTDGKDGQDGTNGSNGNDGATGPQGPQGEQGATPQLKIENGYWYVSYDNGTSWKQLGKATGEDGKDGQDGTNGTNGTDGKDGADGKDGVDGKDGDSFLQSVDTSNSDYVILTLADGTEIKLPTWYAFEQLQKLYNQMNTNISSLQVIVAALQNNDYVQSIVPLMENGKEVGYTITFTKSGAVNIYHGKDGKDGTNGSNGTDGKDGQDGENGTDGKDGHTPIIGVKQHTDGIYYWTIDGEWLLDDNGNKVKAVGTDGKDGANGTDGKDGQDGTNGSNGNDGATGPQGPQGEQGVTPQLKIENGYWYVSYDNGTSWKQLGKATGEDGKDGQDGTNGTNGTNGKDGQDGDSFFKSVTEDENNVYITLTDGTTFTLPKTSSYLFNRLQSITYVPEYSDCKVTMYYSDAGGSITPNSATLKYEVRPAIIAEELATDWQRKLNIQAIYTKTRTLAGEFVSLPIEQVSAQHGILTIVVSGSNLDDAFFRGSISANVRLEVSDGINSITSNYANMLPLPRYTVSIPDANFKTYILEKFDINNDKVISLGEAEKVYNIDISNSTIESVTGIEEFVNLESLDCSNSRISVLDITKNIKLTTLKCHNTALEQLNIANNEDLTTLECHSNAKLETLICSDAFSTSSLFTIADKQINIINTEGAKLAFHIGDFIKDDDLFGVVFQSDTSITKIISTTETSGQWGVVKSWADNYGEGWSLSTGGDLRTVYEQIDIINTRLSSQGYSIFTTSTQYWTSYAFDSNNASRFSFSNGQSSAAIKTYNHKGRAVLAF